jgi:hypothetical protein
MEFINKNRELTIVISSYLSLAIIVLFLVVLYKSDFILTGDHLASANKNAAATISLIIWSVMFGIMVMGTLLNTLRLVIKTINHRKITPSETATNTSRMFSYINTKIIFTLGIIGLILQSVFIALSVNSGSFALVLFWGIMLGITLISSFLLYKQSKLHSNTFSASKENF